MCAVMYSTVSKQGYYNFFITFVVGYLSCSENFLSLILLNMFYTKNSLQMLGCVHCTVGWSDLTFFCNFRKATRFCWSGIFLGGQFQKSANFATCASHAQQSFHFQKTAGTLKMNFCCWKFAESFLIYQRSIAKRKFEIKVC